MPWKIIRDNGTPACLPRWARDEIVALRVRNNRLMMALINSDIASDIIREQFAPEPKVNP